MARAVHSEAYLAFLWSAYKDWRSDGRPGDAAGYVWPAVHRRPLVNGYSGYIAPHYDAFVEECFPAAAMTDPLVFFDAAGDGERFQHNLDRMMDSVHRFIDMDQLDVLPTSQYCC